MPRIWVKVGKKLRCCTSVSSTCYPAQLATVTDDKRLAQGIERINDALKAIQGQGEPGQELAFIVVTNYQGDDVLTLEWVYMDEEVTTYEDQKAQ